MDGASCVTFLAVVGNKVKLFHTVLYTTVVRIDMHTAGSIS